MPLFAKGSKERLLFDSALSEHLTPGPDVPVEVKVGVPRSGENFELSNLLKSYYREEPAVSSDENTSRLKVNFAKESQARGVSSGFMGCLMSSGL